MKSRILIRFSVGAVCVATAANLHAQVVLSGSGPGSMVRIFHTDMAVLEAGEPRKDLPCEVTINKPILGFDLRFHAGYEVTIPMRELAGTENLLNILFRVTNPETHEVRHFSQRVRVPSISEEANGDAWMAGSFDVGQGHYKVAWLVRDRTERVCSSFWDIDAELPPKDREMELAIANGAILACDREQFRDEPRVRRDNAPLNVKVLVNFAPQKSNAATLRPLDTSALVSILRSLSRDPRIGKFSLVAFNLQEQRVLFRQHDSEIIDFPALGDALGSLSLATVDVQRLAQKNGETAFLAGLIQKEVKDAQQADAVVFAGPKAMLEENVPADSLKEIGELAPPVFYMNYNLYPQSVPWTDTIGKAVRFFRGYEYTITRPRDLWYAVSEMVTRIVKLKQGRQSGTSSSSE
ncbi:MAG TPA: acetyltransferase [Bryobacteraceae bacterium]|nr:acetyltransferase [Bryobacteraceae bacterium]